MKYCIIKNELFKKETELMQYKNDISKKDNKLIEIKKETLVEDNQTIEIDKMFIKEFSDKFIKKDDNSYIIWTNLKEIYLNWFLENKNNKLPLTKHIKEYFEKNIFMEEEKSTSTNKFKFRGWSKWKLLKQ